MTMKLFKSVALIIMMTMTTNITAQTVQLPAPATKGGLDFMTTVATRHSVREFDPVRQLSNQQLSDLLWSAVGINRPDTGMRTNPTAINAQEIDAYLFTADGVYLFDPKANTLDRKVTGDHRGLVAGVGGFVQDFVFDAPVSVVLVADVTRYDRPGMADSTAPALDAGIASQNINLYCSAFGLATVPRMTMDAAAIQKLLGLTDRQIPLINNPVGFAK